MGELAADGYEVALGAGDSESDLPLLRAGRWQLVVGNPTLAGRVPADVAADPAPHHHRRRSPGRASTAS